MGGILAVAFFAFAGNAKAYTQADFAAFDGVNIGTNSYTVSSDITATYISGTGTETDPVKLTLTGHAPIITPWFGQNWTTYNYVAIGIKLPTTGFIGTQITGGTAVYQADVMRYDDLTNFPNGYYTVGYGSIPLATGGAALGYLDYEFAANSNNTKKDGLVKLKVIWNTDSAPEYFTIDINGLQLDTATHKFVSTIGQLTSALAAANSGDTITLTSNITTSSELDINKALTLDGAGHKLSASFLRTDNSNNSAIGIKSVDGVTIKNLIVDGTGGSSVWLSQLHGINIYLSTNVNLNDVTAMNFGGAGINVNGSLVTVNNITTSGNSWGGINVDRPTVTNTTTLTVNGISSHNEVNAAIWRDDNAKTNVTVIDMDHQYSQSTYTHDTNVVGTLWKLLATGQIVPENGEATVTPTNKEVVVTATTPITVNLGSVEDATINFDSLITNGEGVIPQTTIISNVAEVKIDDGTKVTATDTNWNGVMQAPTAGDTSGTAPASFSVGNTVIEMGSSQYTLNFDKAVKITLPGVTGRVGYRPAGSTEWQLITTQCTSSTVPGITSGECYVAEGGNTVIWTYHFTSFGGLEPISVNKSGGRSGGGRATILPPQASPVAVGRVLGAETENAAAVALQIASIKAQLADLIRQLITLLQAQIDSQR
ncbi:MAG: hypothetical protein WAZ50_03440 [Minisyncoccia bacterium]